MALSMDEQRILDGMERKLADDDPRLASRLGAFGEPRFAVALGTGRARAAAVVISLALAALVTLMVYTMRPFPPGSGTQAPRQTRVISSPSGQPGISPTITQRNAPSPY
jgi:hypothetical protein